MQDRIHSSTAVLVAAIRAYHSIETSPKIFDDTIARRLISDEEYEKFQQGCARWLPRLDPVLAVSCPDQASLVHHFQIESTGTVIVLVRGRYIEETLHAAVARGLHQYVVIGAGLDTLPFRRPDLGRHLQIFEIDHPASQTFKLARLHRAGIAVPPYLHFAAADLERESVASALQGTSYDPDQPTLFAWPGVTMYLTREAICATLRSIASIAKQGSEVVFDYLESDAFNEDVPARVKVMLERVRECGEPMISGFDPIRLPRELLESGMVLEEDLGPKDVRARFLTADGVLRPSEFWHLARGTIR